MAEGFWKQVSFQSDDYFYITVYEKTLPQGALFLTVIISAMGYGMQARVVFVPYELPRERF